MDAASLLWNGGGTLSLQIGSGTTSDDLALNGAFTKGSLGAYTVDITGTGTAGDVYTLVTFASTTFAATNFTLDLPTGYSGILEETSDSLELDLTSAPAVVSSALPEPALAVGEDVVSSNSFAEPAVAPQLSITPTPEPGGTLLLALGAGGLLGWRRRRTVKTPASDRGR